MTKVDDEGITPPPGGTLETVNRLYDDAARAFVDAAALPAVPPEWVPLAELPGWVAFRYGVPAYSFAGDLVLAVRMMRSELRHRIQISPHRISGRLPPGLQTIYAYPKRTVVADWEAAEADWATGTVVVLRFANSAQLGLPVDYGRLPIEVLWEDVERYVSLRLRQWTLKPPRDSAQTPQGAAAEVTSAEAGISQEKPLPPFDARGAKALLVAKKVGGDWSVAPTEDESRAFLKLHFRGVPNDPHRRIRHEVWADIRRGPPPKKRPAN